MSSQDIENDDGTRDCNQQEHEDRFEILIAQLLEVYGDEAIACLIRLDQALNHPSNGNDSIPVLPIANAVRQTMSLELPNEALQSQGAAALVSLLPHARNDEVFSDVDILVEALSQHPQNEVLNQDSLTVLSHRLAAPNHNLADEECCLRILNSTLPALKAFPANVAIQSSALQIIDTLTSKFPSVIQWKVVEFIPSMVRALQVKNAKVQRDACAALAGVCRGHAINQELIVTQNNHQALSQILDLFKWQAHNASLQEAGVDLLANLAENPEIRSRLLAKGGLDCILTAMKTHLTEVNLQAKGCIAIIHCFEHETGESTPKGASACVRPILQAMRIHTFDADLQRLACQALYILSKHHKGIVIQTGGMATLVIAMREHAQVVALQEHSCAALYQLLSHGTLDDLLSMASEGGVSTLLQVLRAYPKNSKIQQEGLAALSCVSNRQAKQHEIIIAGKGLDVALQALAVPTPRPGQPPPHQHPWPVIKSALQTLQQLTSTQDFQRAVVAKQGIPLLLSTMHRHLPNPVVLRLGCAVIRNVCIPPEHLSLVKPRGIDLLLQIMRRHCKSQASLQAYAIDTLARLAVLRQHQIFLLKRSAIALVMTQMQQYQDHLPIQEQGYAFFRNMTKCEEAALWMKNYGTVATIQASLQQHASLAKPGRELVQQLQSTRLLLARSNNRRR